MFTINEFAVHTFTLQMQCITRCRLLWLRHFSVFLESVAKVWWSIPGIVSFISFLHTNTRELCTLCLVCFLVILFQCLSSCVYSSDSKLNHDEHSLVPVNRIALWETGGLEKNRKDYITRKYFKRARLMTTFNSWYTKISSCDRFIIISVTLRYRKLTAHFWFAYSDQVTKTSEKHEDNSSSFPTLAVILTFDIFKWAECSP